MVFARIAILAVLAVALVNGVPLAARYQPTQEEVRKLMDGVQEFSKIGTEFKKLPGFSNLDLKTCTSQGQHECTEKIMKSLDTLFKQGYAPWSIPKIDPLHIADFETTLPSAKFSFKNVELTGFETMKFVQRPKEQQSIKVLLTKKPEPANFSVDLKVRGKITMTLTTKDKENTFYTDFTKTYPNVNVTVGNTCEKFSWRFQECSKNYEIDQTFNGAPIITLTDDFRNDIVYQEWFTENLNDIHALRGELLKKYVKEYVESMYGVFYQLQKKFESSVDGDKIDYFFSFMIDHAEDFFSQLASL